MRTKTIKLYQFSELSEKAQQTAIDAYRTRQEWFGGDECVTSLKAFCTRVGINLRDWSLGDRSNVSWEFDAIDCYRWSEDWFHSADTGHDGSHMKGVRLWKWLMNDNWTFTAKEIKDAHQGGCLLTGMWSDNPFFDAFARFLERPDQTTTFDDLLQEAKADFESACNQDCEYCFSDECIRESIEANDPEFTEEGQLA